MLADRGAPPPETVGLPSDVHMSSAQRFALIDFIGGQLPIWRDRPDRRPDTAETALTSHFSRHLNGVARKSLVWNFVQFSVEDRDEVRKDRKTDLAAAPSGVKVWIEGRAISDQESILPIECKRLPTPPDNGRDSREYLFSSHRSAGGVQRFKAGHHGANHSLCAMIAYVQADDLPVWHDRVNEWVGALTAANEAGWSAGDALTLDKHDLQSRWAMLQSRHVRAGDLSDVELRHLWIVM